MAEAVVNKKAVNATKKIRQRKKNLFLQIREQMEFYFSDANLQKDRFLKQLVQSSSDGLIDINVFLKFNKIKTMTTDINTIIAAVKKSELLKVDESLMKVGRKNEFIEPKDVDERTVYVECLPQKATIDWLRKVFSDCGKVVYVSLPRFKSTRDIKGFAFIEFLTKQQAEAACESLNNPPISVMNDRPGIFPRASKMERQLEKQINKTSAGRKRKTSEGDNMKDDEGDGGEKEVDDINNVSTVKKSKVESIEPQANNSNTNVIAKVLQQQHVENVDNIKSVATKIEKKRKGKNNFDAGGDVGVEREVVETKKIKQENVEDDKNTNNSNNNNAPTNKKKSKQKRRLNTENESTSGISKKNDNIDDGSGESKMVVTNVNGKQNGDPNIKVTGEKDLKVNSNKQGKNNNRGESKVKLEVVSDDVHDDKNQKLSKTVPELRVMPKSEWLKLRQDYLVNQKTNMSKLKKQLKILNERLNNKNQSNDMDTMNTTDAKLSIQSANSIDQSSNSINSQSVSTTLKPSNHNLSFVPNVIVKITLPEPMSKKFLKEKLSIMAKIKFVEMNDEDVVAQVRCTDEDSSHSLINQAPSFNWHAHLLQGDDERAYWDKAFSDREQRLNTKTKKNKTRGKDKLLKKADKCMEKIKEMKKHVIFDD